jgi:alkylation response protein AidB-like acyl-CoA dehydrogenase
VDDLAQYADWIFCLVRTDPSAKKQEGISFLLIDMKSPGVTVRPIIRPSTAAARSTRCSSTDVKVPVENLDRRGEQGLGLRQVPARQRAHRHCPRRHVEACASRASANSPRARCRRDGR